MIRLLVNIRGTNGSGKSTIPISMMDDPDVYMVEKPYEGRVRQILTVFPNYKWVALGSYAGKTGGLDKFPDKIITEKALWYALKKFPEYDVIMEGILASTVFSTYSDIFHRVEEKYPDTKVIVFNMLPPFETCLERVYSRNGGKPVKEGQIEYKWKIVQRNIQKFKNEGFITLKVDTSKVSKDDMLPKFLKTVNKYKEDV